MVTVDKMMHLIDLAGFDRHDSADGGGTQGHVGFHYDAEKVMELGQGTKHDVCASTASSRRVSGTDRIGDVVRHGVCHAFTPDGRCVSLFKTLYTNHCTHECLYCPNAGTCHRKVYSYTPEELAKITMALYRGNYIEGLFLSSGIGRDEDTIMEKMLETVELLRTKYRFMGYVHLKILPGSGYDHIKRAVELADRVSINIEATSRSRMADISSTKDYGNDIIKRQFMVREAARKLGLPAGQTTQLIVGAADESDRDILRRVVYEYRTVGVKRSYYSAFTPVEGTGMEGHEAAPLWRERRLYQMDWLYRVYGFSPREIETAFDDNGFIGNRDPKAVMARHLLDGAVDPNTASRKELLTVPGIGPVSARRILTAREKKRITKLSQLAALGVVVKRAAPFLKLNGWHGTTLDRWLT